mmetsp:Transcript_36465/g.66371  ORF Transcript_36465/g.66371 Transcript_36465/m.66371 type:complete len:996 (-) Transcript_36465:53-3040(-)
MSMMPADGRWQAVLDAAKPAIVALHVVAVRGFQDDSAGVSGGTGFVVDAEKGLLLTNRHVCTCGPVRASATFVGSAAMEELPVEVAYVDPIHDYGFLRFNPAWLRQTPRAEIALEPGGCRVGEEIRVIGNDSLEKLQILSGTVARIDRNAPDMRNSGQDENTFYYAATTGTRGGSSGSPVLNSAGHACALNAAAITGTMVAMFLPLHRIARALDALRRGAVFPRGTLCAALTHESFPACTRLGVSEEFVQRSVLGGELPPGGTFTKAAPPGGMLKVQRCLPGTEAAKSLAPGDVLLELNGRPCVDFVVFEEILDSFVGRTVQIVCCRGGSRIEASLAVQDLHGLVPRAFVELGFGVFHQVPYKTAQMNHLPLEGIYVAQAGFVFGQGVKKDSLVLAVNGVPCNCLKDFEEAVQQVPDKEYFEATWLNPHTATDRRNTSALLKMNRQWCAFRSWAWDSATLQWKARLLHSGGAAESDDQEEDAEELQEEEAVASQADGRKAKKAKTSKQAGALKVLEKCLCTVRFQTSACFDTNLILDSSEEQSEDVIARYGLGIILDAEAGLILTDRATVPQPLGDIEVFSHQGSSCGASAWFIDPLHSFVVLRLHKNADGVLRLGDSATFKERAFEAGDTVDFVGLGEKGERFAANVKVQGVRLEEFPRHDDPRWHERNLEAIYLADEPASSGVLCDAQGHIHAVYVTASMIQDETPTRVSYGLPAHILQPLLEHIRSPQGREVPPSVPSLEVSFGIVDLRTLQRLPGHIRPPAKWLQKLLAAGGAALKVLDVTPGGPCEEIMQSGDLLVAISDEVVASVRDVDDRLRDAVLEARKKESDGPLQVKLTLFTRSAQREVTATVPLLGSDGARRVLCWHGLVVQETPRAARECCVRGCPRGVYISRTLRGSPAEAHEVEGDFLIAVDETPTPTLDALVAAGKGKMRPRQQHEGTQDRVLDRRYLRVETVDIRGKSYVAMLEPDDLFWPISELSQDELGVFSRTDIE